MMETHNLQEYQRFLAAKLYTSVGSEEVGITSFDVVESNPATQEKAYVAAVRSRPREGVQLVKVAPGADTVWTVSGVVRLRGDEGHGVSDDLDRAKAEREKRRRLVGAIQDLGRLVDGWAGEGSVAPSNEAIKDAVKFVSLLPEGIPEPSVCAADDGEILVDWVVADRKVVVGLEGDGELGYALYQGGSYKPGNQEGNLSAHDLPSDLKSYLQSMKEQ